MSLPTIQRVRGAFCWQSGMNVDGDGSARAYGDPHQGFIGLDALGNAGHPGNWYGIVTNSSGVPVVQGPNDPRPGFYVSSTSLCDRSKAATDPARYVDAEAVPYVVVPPEFLRSSFGVRLSDLCMVLYKERAVAAIVADVGPHDTLGEGSIALATALGIPSSPRNGGVQSGVSWVLFPGSGAGWPVSVDDFSMQASLLFQQWGGGDGLAAAFPNS